MAETQTVQTVQRADPWSGQQPYLQDLYYQAYLQAHGGGPQYYGGSTVAGMNPAMQAGQQSALQAAQTTIPELANTAGRTSNTLMGAMDINNNPFAQGAMEAAIRPVTNQFMGTVMPGIRADFSGGSNYGSSRRENVTTGATGQYLQNAFDTTQKMGATMYGQGLQAAGQALALAPQTQQMQLGQAQIFDAVGQQRRGYEQQLIDDQVNRWNFAQQRPGAMLRDYQNVLQGSPGGTTTSDIMAPTPRGNPALGAIGGAAAGYSLGSATGTAYGGAIGALAGGLYGYYGSR